MAFRLRSVAAVAMVLILHTDPAIASAKVARLADLWEGRAHFRQVGTIDWSDAPGQHSEIGTWYTVRGRLWYAFSRAYLNVGNPACTGDYTRVVVRKSGDHGTTWSSPVTVADPGVSAKGDGCAILDGSSIYDARAQTWHMLAQCMALWNAGGWSLCHYTRTGASPMGRFVPDPANPVVRGGGLWSRICSGAGKECPPTTYDEGTPDIVEKRQGEFWVTFHGAGPGAKTAFRGVAASRDFVNWRTSGRGLPDDAVFGAKDCDAWLAACIGTGAVDSVIERPYIYMIGEIMNKSLACQTDQTWHFELYRSRYGSWKKSQSGAFEKLAGPPLLKPGFPDAATPCPVNYARFVRDASGIYLIYEDWGPGRAFLKRRLMKLVYDRASDTAAVAR